MDTTFDRPEAHSARRRPFSPAISRLALAMPVMAALLSSPLAAQHEHHHHQPPAEPAADEAVPAMTIPDTILVDQDGREIRFYTDLVEDRIVAMNFIFTTCTTVCPPMGANFSKLQKLLPEAAGREVQMISVSVDPAVDTPPRLDAWASKLGRREEDPEHPSWTLVTGDKPEVDKLLKALKVFTADKNDHSPIVLVGDDRRGEWTRAYGLAPPSKLAEMVGELVENGTAATAGGSR